MATLMLQKDVPRFLLDVAQALRQSLDPELPMQTFAILLVVACEPGISMKEVGNRLDVSKASITRNVVVLGHDGFGLLRAYDHPEEARQKAITLTSKGERFVNELTTLVNQSLIRVKHATK